MHGEPADARAQREVDPCDLKETIKAQVTAARDWDGMTGPGVMSLPHVVSAITSGSMAISAAGSPVVYRRDVTVPAYGWCNGGAWMARRSAALLVFRLSEERGLEVLLGHMGGPFWEKKDARAWSIPKGEYEEGEEPAAAALREFEEEMGSPPPSGDMLPLGESRQPSGKVITTYAAEGDYEPGGFHSNTFTMGAYSFIAFKLIFAPKFVGCADKKFVHISTGQGERFLRKNGKPGHDNGPAV